MNKFLKHSNLFFLFILLIYGISFGINQWLFKNDVFKSPSTSILIIGDSHTKCSLDPNLIYNSINISQTAEPYIITYYKLKLITDNNPQIEKVVLSFSPINFAGFHDIKFKDKVFANNVFKTYYPIISQDDLVELNYDTEVYTKAFLKHEVLLNPTYVMNGVKRILGKGKASYPYIGSFIEYNSDFKDNSESRINSYYYKGDSLLAPSELSKKYLLKIVSLLEQENIPLILINTPVHSNYRNSLPETYQTFYNEIEREIEVKDLISIVNLEALFEGDKYFRDCDHLNAKGAKVFSLHVNQLMKDL